MNWKIDLEKRVAIHEMGLVVFFEKKSFGWDGKPINDEEFFKAHPEMIIKAPTLMREAGDAFMEELKRSPAYQLGKKGGAVKSETKARSSAENGKKGGRPKKVKLDLQGN